MLKRWFPILCALLAASPAAAQRLGLHPISLPSAEQSQADRLAAWLREAAQGAPGVGAVEMLPRSACLPDEGRCLAAATRAAPVDVMVTAGVQQMDRGYRWQLRRFSPRGDLKRERRGEVQGGPLDLAGALEGGLCDLLEAAPCTGELAVQGPEGARVVVDGRDAGVLPLAKPLTLPVGRHAVHVGEEQKRIRISRGKLASFAGGAASAAGPAQPVAAASSGAAVAAPMAAQPAQVFAPPLPHPSADGRSAAARAMVATGLGLIAAAAGVGLYAQLQTTRGDAQSVPSLTAASQAGSAQSHLASVIATGLVATGVGALACGGVLFALTPSGAAVGGRF